MKASQRQRLLQAMLNSVAQRGYPATTVADVVASARVSTNTFYEFFDDKLDCFLALCDEEARGMLDTVVAAASEPTWRDAMRRGMRAYLQWWQDRPAFSRAYVLEVPAAGPRAIAQRERASESFVDMFEELAHRARREEPYLPSLPALAPQLLVAGVTELVAREVREGHVSRLSERAPDFEALVIAVLASGANGAG